MCARAHTHTHAWVRASAHTHTHTRTHTYPHACKLEHGWTYLTKIDRKVVASHTKANYWQRIWDSYCLFISSYSSMAARIFAAWRLCMAAFKSGQLVLTSLFLQQTYWGHKHDDANDLCQCHSKRSSKILQMWQPPLLWQYWIFILWPCRHHCLWVESIHLAPWIPIPTFLLWLTELYV